MAITVLEDLLELIQAREMQCAYELIVFYAAIKLKDKDGGFDREKLVDFFINFYILGVKYDLQLEESCDPLIEKDPKDILLLLNRNPISILLKEGILKTFERFDPEVFEILFEDEEEILKSIEERIVKHFLETSGNTIAKLESLTKEWIKLMNSNIKSDTLKHLADSYDQINLEYLLKYLFQSYSLKSLQRLVEDFHLTPIEFKRYFTGGVDLAAIFPAATEAELEGGEAEEVKEAEPSSAAKVKDLSRFYQQMMDTDVEEDYIRNPPKTKGKKKKRFFKKSK
jgi:hypothetical protein